MRQLKVIKDPDDEIPVEIFEQAIVDIARGFNKMNSSRLSKRAIVLLIQDSVGTSVITKKQVERVLDATANLETQYLKKVSKS